MKKGDDVVPEKPYQVDRSHHGVFCCLKQSSNAKRLYVTYLAVGAEVLALLQCQVLKNLRKLFVNSTVMSYMGEH
ncbi:hypothetical protein L1987_17492 [Smallanthus sonchifolius]|uniref:Uncharacterized protein n=1 Tax=Smallanthus sonchifolius TaxID=185202 RepID=A0ACB9IZK6_9ASTR|nr:hypothetical protein L1987_17492 [Smallanthus sonchifolius]